MQHTLELRRIAGEFLEELLYGEVIEAVVILLNGVFRADLLVVLLRWLRRQ